MAGGLIGALLAAAFGAFQCAKCGKIPTQEFSPDIRTQMRRNSALMIIGAMALVVVVFWLISIK